MNQEGNEEGEGVTGRDKSVKEGMKKGVERGGQKTELRGLFSHSLWPFSSNFVLVSHL